jgi:iron complex transport system ATP-binding protein
MRLVARALPLRPVLPSPGSVVLSLRGVSARRCRREVLRDVDLDVVAGEVLAVVGPNGAGKSTLLAVLAGDVAPCGGDALLDERPLSEWTAGELALRRAVLPQQSAPAFGFSVRDVVRMGRAPWRQLAAPGEDNAHVDAALATAEVEHLADRPVNALSGGEQARVGLARVLAQDTAVVLLDEPTAALDLRHSEEVLRHTCSLAAAGRAVVAVLHDLDLAAAYGDRIALVADGRLTACGRPDDVLTRALLSEVYGCPVDVVPDPRTGRPLVLPHRAP